jgi:hypothetical protein
MTDKKEERVSTMSDRIIDFDFSKLDSPFARAC